MVARRPVGVEALVEDRPDDTERVGEVAHTATRRRVPSPDVGSDSPSRMRMLVVLPAPFAPRKAVTRPDEAVAVKPSSAARPSRSAWKAGGRKGLASC